MMSLILLIIGVVLFYTGRIEIAGLRAEGRPVKAAGVILTLPAMISLLFINFFVPLAVGRNYDAMTAALGVISALEMIGMLVAVGLAYVLIADPPNAPRLPGILGEIQAEARQRRQNGTVQPPARQNRIITIPTPRLNREQFPSVMSLKEAARYLQTSEAEVLQLIEEGKLTASRENFGYKIARSQLDDLREA